MANLWFELNGRTRLHLPSRIREWITLESSMTERIGQVAGDRISVEVLRQAQGRLHDDERIFFPNAVDGATVREVCLSAAGRPLMIARTVFTSRRLRTHPTIQKLGSRPLGSLLFANGQPSPYTAREFARIGPEAALFGLIRKRHGGLSHYYWGRRTRFLLFKEPLLVTEIFLPDLIHRPAAITSPFAAAKAESGHRSANEFASAER